MKMNKWMVIVVVILVWVIDSRAEYRLWTAKDGSTVEAELVNIAGEKVVLKLQDGSLKKVLLSGLSIQDRKYAELNSPPKIEVKVTVDTKRENRTGPAHHSVQVQAESVQCEVELIKVGSKSYDAPLKAHCVMLAEVEQRDYLMIVDRKVVPFNFKNEKSHVFTTKPMQFEQRNSGSSTTAMGKEYEGYLVVITDPNGKVLQMKASRDSLEDHAELLMISPLGTVFDEKFEVLKKGNLKRKGGPSQRKKCRKKGGVCLSK